MLAAMVAACLGNKEAGRYAQMIRRKLTGVADPAKVNKRGMGPDEIKRRMMGLM